NRGRGRRGRSAHAADLAVRECAGGFRGDQRAREAGRRSAARHVDRRRARIASGGRSATKRKARETLDFATFGSMCLMIHEAAKSCYFRRETWTRKFRIFLSTSAKPS